MFFSNLFFRRRELLLCLVVFGCLAYANLVLAAEFATSCDYYHVHRDVDYGRWVPCEGSAWRSSSDPYRIYMKGIWTKEDADLARYWQNQGRCLEMRFHYNGNSISGIAWGSNSATAVLDYDAGEYNVDIHLRYWGSAAYNSGYIQNWVKCNRKDIIGTSYVRQIHFDDSGNHCYGQVMCCIGAYKDTSGKYYDCYGEWYSRWKNGDRHGPYY